MKVFGITGWSGSGKTTLIKSLIPEIKARGFSVSTIKHAHHTFDVDKPGKDSFEHRRAGACEVLISSSKRWVLMHENNNEKEHSLGELSSLYDCTIDGNMNYTNNNRYNHNDIGSNEPWFTSFSNGNHPTTVDFLYFTTRCLSCACPRHHWAFSGNFGRKLSERNRCFKINANLDVRELEGRRHDL